MRGWRSRCSGNSKTPPNHPPLKAAQPRQDIEGFLSCLNADLIRQLLGRQQVLERQTDFLAHRGGSCFAARRWPVFAKRFPHGTDLRRGNRRAFFAPGSDDVAGSRAAFPCGNGSANRLHLAGAGSAVVVGGGLAGLALPAALGFFPLARRFGARGRLGQKARRGRARWRPLDTRRPAGYFILRCPVAESLVRAPVRWKASCPAPIPLRHRAARFQRHPAERDPAEYRAVSGLAIGALLLGIASVSALAGQVLWGVPLVGTITALAALVRIDRAGGALAGRPAALWGLALSVFFGAIAPAHFLTSERLLARRAEEVGRQWFAAMAQGEPQVARQLALPARSRAKISDPAQLWNHYRDVAGKSPRPGTIRRRTADPRASRSTDRRRSGSTTLRQSAFPTSKPSLSRPMP